ncbi:bifunctional metallophosphatase/5'-nucleotidase [Cytobacillus gottheilii]|uniref:bifunctional metallophosphatase/5'-nucleotidase n=1 Tax=Cytobacillus gottheilii TaxID=859144 RepID=UPI0009BB9243|nr:bifunctional UDP-sugar hydrolase/5'-nucleotidase [Cytobacillus gottheilii]
MVKVNILVTSDIHGNVLPIHYGSNEYSEVGLAKISTIIKREKRENKHTILIDNGDLIQGTPLTYHFARYLNHKMNPMIKLLNELSYDAAIVGNHEFNYGMKILNQAVEESHFPWLSANIIHAGTGNPYFGKPYIIKQFEEGLKVAILGITTHYIPNWESPENIKDLTFQDALQTAKDWVQHIREKETPNVLIVSYHGGFECDPATGEATEALTGENQGYRICHEIEGIDVLITGHQHRRLAGEINGVSIVQPGFNGQALGKVAVTLTKEKDEWSITDKKASLLELAEGEADASCLDLIQEYETQTQQWLDQPIGKVYGDMTISDPLKARLKDHALVEFINQVQMEAAHTDISNTALFNNELKGFKNKITMRDIVSNYIYPNTLTVIRITGQDIKDALERSADYFTINNGEISVSPSFSTPKPQHYNYDMWEGIDYILDLSKPVGNRVIKLKKNGLDIDLTAEYDVVMNNYRAAGGGDYHMFKDKPVIKEISLDMSEILANYILERGKIEASVNENWKVIW